MAMGYRFLVPLGARVCNLFDNDVNGLLQLSMLHCGGAAQAGAGMVPAAFAQWAWKTWPKMAAIRWQAKVRRCPGQCAGCRGSDMSC